MRVLSLSTDKNIFESGSLVQRRMLEYAKIFEELHIMVITRRLDFKITKIDNVFVYPVNVPIIKLFYFIGIILTAKKILKDRSSALDFVITAQDPFETGLSAYILKLIYGLPIQLQVHTDFLSPYFARESFLNKIRILIAKFLLPRADRVRVVSERIKKSFVVAGLGLKNDPEVLPVFVDVKKIQSSEIKTDVKKKYPDFDFIILMALRLTREKNIGLAIRAMSEVVKRNSRVLLLVVGSGPELNKLKEERDGLKIQKNVVFENWTDDLVSYYKTADCFLLTSNYEGYGRTVIEAMACGLPVIMTDVGLAGEIIKNNVNGLVIPVGDANRLIEAVNLLLENKDKRRDLAEKARNFGL